MKRWRKCKLKSKEPRRRAKYWYLRLKRIRQTSPHWMKGINQQKVWEFFHPIMQLIELLWSTKTVWSLRKELVVKRLSRCQGKVSNPNYTVLNMLITSAAILLGVIYHSKLVKILTLRVTIYLRSSGIWHHNRWALLCSLISVRLILWLLMNLNVKRKVLKKNRRKCPRKSKRKLQSLKITAGTIDYSR